MIRYVPRYSGVLRVGIRVIVELYIVGPRRLRVDELRLIMMRARRGMRDASVEVALGQGSPRRGNSSKGGDSDKPSLEGGKGREALEGETPRREGTRIHRPSKGERELGPSKGWSVVFGLRRFCLTASKAGGSVAASGVRYFVMNFRSGADLTKMTTTSLWINAKLETFITRPCYVRFR